MQMLQSDWLGDRTSFSFFQSFGELLRILKAGHFQFLDFRKLEIIGKVMHVYTTANSSDSKFNNKLRKHWKPLFEINFI